MKSPLLTRIAFPVLLVSFSITWTIQSHAQGPLFVPAPQSPVAVGQGSGDILLADLNRDGHLDLLTKHLLAQHVTVRLGDGKGNFAQTAGSPMTFAYQPGAVALGDVNDDGILDLAVASKDAESEYLRVFLGNGKGGFNLTSAPPITVSKSIETYKPILHFGDVNEDRRMDIVMANGRRSSIEIIYGDGKGNFTSGPVVKLEPGQNRYYFALGDIDRDRHLDLVIASSVETEGVAGRLTIKRGNGKGAFADASGSPLSAPPGPRLGMLADVNGDQQLDIVLNHNRDNHLTVLLNRGNGKFTPAPGSAYDIGAEAFGLVVADVNGDKKSDIVAAAINSVSVLLGDSSGFRHAPGSPFKAGPGAYNVAVGDINEDGKLDLAASSFEGKSVTVLLGR